MTRLFCAICLAPTIVIVERPLGRNDEMVNVCAACNDDHPRQGRYSFGGGSNPITKPSRSTEKGGQS